MKFTAQILTDSEFDSLPYRNISDSLGIADVTKGLVFVRRTGFKELDLANLSHEIDHLVETHATDADEDGIRHKKGGALRKIIPIIVGAFNPPLGAAIGAGMGAYASSRHPEQLGSPLQGAIGGGLTGYAGGSALGTAAKGFSAGAAGSTGGLLGKTLSGIKGAFVGTPATVGGSPISVINPAGAAATPGFVEASKGLLGSAGVLGGVKNPFLAPGSLTTPSGVLPSASSGNQPVMSLASGGQGNILGQQVNPPTITQTGLSSGVGVNAPAPASTLSSGIKDFFKEPKNVLGAGSLLASTLPTTPEFKIPDSVDTIRQNLLSGMQSSPLGKQAAAELQAILSSKPENLFPVGTDAYFAEGNKQIDVGYDNAKKRLDAIYNNAGMLNSGEYLDQMRLLTEAREQEKYFYVQREQQRRFELANNEKVGAIQKALEVDQNTALMLADIARLDVATAAAKYQTNANEINQLRNILQKAGISLLTDNKVTV